MNDTDIVEKIDVEINEIIDDKLDEPRKYKVIFFNDDATPMEWVIGILNGIFKHSLDETLSSIPSGSDTIISDMQGFNEPGTN